MPSIYLQRSPAFHLVVLGIVFSFPLLAQKPVIASGGIVNSASLKRDPDRETVLVEGEIATIFGTDLSASEEIAQSFPLPTMLAGTSVTFGGMPAPLYYVSPSQINFQVPTGEGGRSPFGFNSQIVVSTAGGSSDPSTVKVVFDAAGIFTQDGSGCGPGAVQNVNSDGTVTLNTPLQSASPGDLISIYGTGLGPVNFPPPDGSPASSDPLSLMQSGGSIIIGLSGFAELVTPSFGNKPGEFAGLAPGLVGVHQVNVHVPTDAPEGCAVPLRLFGTATTSQQVTISIRKGGGPCQDSPLSRIGNVNWVKSVTTGPNSPTSLETVQATLAEAPGNEFRIPQGPHEIGRYFHSGPNCPGSAGKRLDAGPLTVQSGTNNPFTFSPSVVSGELVYQSPLPPGTIQPGTVHLSATGGTDLGPFQAAISLPPPIQITTSLPPGATISASKAFRLDWTGGSADTLVRVRLVSPIPLGYEVYYERSAAGSDGTVTLPPLGLQNKLRFPIPPNDPARVEVLVTPVQPGAFSAPSFAQPGVQNWTYEYKFTGLRWAQ